MLVDVWNRVVTAFALFVTLVCLALFGDAHASDWRLLGSGGFETMRPRAWEQPELKTPLRARDVALMGQLTFFDFIPGFALLLGGGGRYVTGETVSTAPAPAESGNTQVNSLSLSVPYLTTEAGAQLSLFPFVTFQGAMGWDFGMDGAAVLKTSGGPQSVGSQSGGSPQSGSLQQSSLRQVHQAWRFNMAGRVLFTLLPFVKVGVELSRHAGNFTLRAADGFDESTNRHSGNAVRGLVTLEL